MCSLDGAEFAAVHLAGDLPRRRGRQPHVRGAVDQPVPAHRGAAGELRRGRSRCRSTSSCPTRRSTPGPLDPSTDASAHLHVLRRPVQRDLRVLARPRRRSRPAPRRTPTPTSPRATTSSRSAPSTRSGSRTSPRPIHEWTVDLLPETFIDSAPPSQTLNPIAHVPLVARTSAFATFECALDAPTFWSCPGDGQFLDLLVGSHALRVRAVDTSGNVDPTPAVHRWTVGPMPDTFIISGPEEVTQETTATFVFGSNLPGVRFECALDEMVEDLFFLPCGSPWTFDDLMFGEHELLVRAVDAAGNVDPIPAEWSWEIGGVPPPVLIESGPDLTTERPERPVRVLRRRREPHLPVHPRRRRTPGRACRARPTTACRSARTSSRSSVLVGDRRRRRRAGLDLGVDGHRHDRPRHDDHRGPARRDRRRRPGGRRRGHGCRSPSRANDPRATFECAIDGELFEQCENPFDRLGPGARRALLPRPRRPHRPDRPDASTPTRRRRAGSSPSSRRPRPRSTSVPRPRSSAARPGSSSRRPCNGSTFECAIDLGPFFACPSPYEISGLPDGEHILEVRSRTPFGILDTTPEEWSWDTDGNLPETTIVSGPQATTTSTSAAFTFSSSEPAEFECSLDGGLFEGCEEGPVAAARPAVDRPPGDRADPRPAHAARPRRRRGRPLRPDAGELHVDDRAAAGDDDRLRAGRPDLGDERAPSTSPRPTRSRTLRVRARRRRVRRLHLAGRATPTWRSAGTASPSARSTRPATSTSRPATHGWTIQAPAETTPPDTIITLAPDARTTSTTRDLPLLGQRARHDVRVLARRRAVRALRRRGSTYTELALGDAHVPRSSATDAAGNVELEPASTRWTIVAGDATPPETYITSAPLEVEHERRRDLRLRRDRDRRDVRVLARTCTPSSRAPRRSDYVGLGGGDYQFYVRAIDAAGNVDPSPALYEWTVEDVTPPDTQLVELPADPSSTGTARFGFVGTDNTVVVEGEFVPLTFECRLDSHVRERLDRVREPADLHRPGRRPPHLRGARRRRGRQRRPDARRSTPGRSSTRRRPRRPSTPGRRRRRRAPARSSSSRRTRPARPSSARSTAPPFAACTSPHQYTGLAVGPHEFQRPRDRPAGNVDADAGQLHLDGPAPPDTTAPETTIDSGPPAETGEHGRRRSPSPRARPARPSSARSTASAFNACISPLQLTDLSVGVHQLRVRATDAAGNADLTPASRNWRVTPPPETTILTGPAARDREHERDLHVPGRPGRRDVRVRARPGHRLRAVRVRASPTPASRSAPHEFFVRAAAAEGNVEPTPAAYELGDRRPDAAGRDDHVGPAIATHRHDADVRRSAPTTRTPSSSARSTARRSSSASRRRPTPRPRSPPAAARSPARTPSRCRPQAAPARRPGRRPSGSGRSRTTRLPRRPSSPARRPRSRSTRRSRRSSSRATSSTPSSSARSTRSGSRSSASAPRPPDNLAEFGGLLGRRAHAARARRRPEPERRPDAGVVHVDGRRAARHHHPLRPGRGLGDDRDDRDLHLRRRPGRRRPTCARSTAPSSPPAPRRSSTPRPT